MAIGPVAVLEPITGEAQARIMAICEGFDLRFPKSGAPKNFAEIIGDAKYVVTRGLRFPPEVLERANALELIHQWGTGIDGIPLEKARDRGIAVARSPGINAPTVAEGTIALMLATLRRLPQVHADFRSGQWDMPDLWKQSRDLGSCTVGLVGMGAIAQEVVKRLRGFGCEVIYTRASGPSSEIDLRFADLPQLLAEADIVSLHLPLTETSRHLIDATAIAKMKPEAILINTSRGGVVDEAALIAALREGRLGAAGLDVFDTEPANPDNPLLGMDSTVTLPHVAARTLDNFDRMVSHWAGNIRAHAEGRRIDPACIVLD
ncbi:2-hydroxyacid dehydrogenase [Paracoccus saliphilus]|uniref:2-hydroxyacid dehydrogenase n=1 Tax=Paracoccus saliphilus TaxID=405559 RepID=A0AA46A3X3_9RHOB|nr:2-hydroxyacid dehydrogenase [Paracoccus saliphilus]WCR03343.1 2-hydroxyacid dehydrogenase [Paracoccus saliphilus]SIS51861.1 Lactate dehydrogenase [Paracoccus saliphilus]